VFLCDLLVNFPFAFVCAGQITQRGGRSVQLGTRAGHDVTAQRMWVVLLERRETAEAISVPPPNGIAEVS